MKIKSFIIPACIVSFLGFASCSNISSSELTQTAAEDLRLYVQIYEHNDEDNADVSALLQTIPDHTGIQFTQGETLEAGTADDDDAYTAMTYDNSFFDIGEMYVAEISKPDTGDDYFIRYTDEDDVETVAVITSDGVPELILPAENTEVEIDSELEITWDSQDTGNMYIKLTFETSSGGSSTYQDSIPDTGSYTLDLSDSEFAQMAPGEATVSLIHNTEYDEMDGFGDANITVSSYYDREIVIVEQ